MKANNKSIKKKMKKLKRQFPEFAILREKAASEKDALAAKQRETLATLMGEIFS